MLPFDAAIEFISCHGIFSSISARKKWFNFPWLDSSMLEFLGVFLPQIERVNIKAPKKAYLCVKPRRYKAVMRVSRTLGKTKGRFSESE
jgi:hypothetical protein